MDIGKARHAAIVFGCLLAAACGGSSGSDSGGGGQDLPSVNIDSPTVQEGDSGTVDMTFTLTLSEAAPGAATVRYETADGDATAGEDYTAVSGILDVAAGDTSATVVVPVLGDVLDEADETFTLELSDATGATLVTRSATGTIRDDDGPPALTSQAVTVTEGDADDVTVSFDLVLGAPSARTVTVNYATADGSATAGEDYEAVSGDVSFAPGETSQTVAVTVFGDVVDESAETFTLELSGAQNATLVDASVTATIVDNDGVPSLSIGSVTVAEDAATATFPVTLSNPGANPVTVDYTTVDGTATAGEDYEAVAATLTVPAGETAGSVTVSILDDTLDEDSESFSVTLSNATNADIAVSTAAATINDNDSVARIAVGEATVTEGDAGSVDLDFAVSLSTPSGRPVSVSYSTVDGTATQGEDYTGVTGTLEFAPGETSGIVTVAAIGDTLDEVDETLSLALSNPVSADLGVADATGTILDDDAPPSLTLADATVSEGDAGTVLLNFGLNLDAPSGRMVSVGYATADGTASAGSDYTQASGTLTLDPGATAGTIEVEVLGDTLDEADETLTVTLSNPDAVTLADTVATGTIQDDDGPPALSSESVTVTEGDADDVTVFFELLLDASSSRTVTVSYATADGSATAGADYSAVSGDVSFAPGETSKTVSVTVFGDVIDESAETFTLELSGAQNATLADTSVTATIVDNDGVPSISIGGVTVAEDAATASFPVTLSNPVANPVTVDYTTVDGTAVASEDYEAVAATLTFPAGETAGSIVVSILDDTLDEDSESFSVTLSNATNADIAVSTAAATINDNDSAALIAVAEATVTEGDAGGVDLNFAVSLSAPSGRPVSASYSTVDGTATEGEDYAGVTGTVDFAPGETAATVTVGVVGDTLDEADETLTLALSNPVNADLGDADGTGTILDDDAPPSLAIADAAVSEGNAGTVLLNFDLSLDAPSGRTISVAYATADETATAGDDYTAASGTLTINPGATAATIEVEVLGDTLDEEDETLTVTLSNPDAVTLADTGATGTIQDDDGPPGLSIADASLVEGDSGSAPMTFAVSLNAESGRTVTVDYATADGSATAGEDYTGAAGSLTFDPGVTQQTIEVPVLGDTAAESDETFTVTLSAPANATLTDAEATGTIQDDQDGSGGGPVSGLSQRPSNTTCLAGDAPALVTGIDTAVAFPNLPAISQPIALRQLPGDASHWYLAQKGGVIVRFENRADVASVTTFVDIDARVNSGANEAGLLGMAFHPDFATNGEVYLSYTAGGLTSRISRFTSPDGGVTLDPNSEEILLTLNQPYSNHNGGNILFGPDGYLYIGFGDGGSGGDPGDRAQNTTNLFGAMLRIDVDNGSPYGIPSDNPFAANASCTSGTGAAACPEIYAWGLRNPWRWSFDAATGELWVGDVGQNSWEEVDILELGGNYGWRCREGAHDFNTSGNCPAGLIDPVIEYDHGVGRSITGGYVYRGSAIPELVGRYVFADLNGKIFVSVSDGAGGYGYETLLATGNSIVSFAEDENGELLYLDYGASTVRRIVQAGGSSTGTVADQLSGTGCVDPADPTQPASALIPYTPIAAFWSDGAAKERWYSLPDGATVDVDAESDWVFPIGSVIVKNFRLGGDLIETRLFMRHNDGDWAGYTYEWNDTQTEATRVVGGKTKDINGQTWIYPSGAECLECHTQVAGDTLGLEHAQLNSELTYPSTGITANQLVTADEIDVLTAPLADVPDNLPRLADPADTSAPLEARARAYLHTNCANCHQPNGPTPSNIDLRYSTPFAQTNTCGVVPLQGDLGIADARIIAPGDAARSILLVRTNRRDVHGMPPLGSNLVDTAGVQLLTEWVNSLVGCP